MSILQSIILGIIQGLTEFFPVSSSGHLVIAPFFLNWNYIPLYYTVTVHFATLVALLTAFYKEIFRIAKSLILAIFLESKRSSSESRLGVFLLIATIPVVAAGFALEKYAEDLFSRPHLVAIFLVVTAVTLWVGELRGKRLESKVGRKVDFNLFISVMVGIGQSVAILPGISRSGATISFARFFGISREKSVKFSFLLSVPAIFGSFIFELFKSYNIIFDSSHLVLKNLAVGFLFSYISGLFAIKLLINFTKRKNLNIFAIYCACLAVVIFILYIFRNF